MLYYSIYIINTWCINCRWLELEVAFAKNDELERPHLHLQGELDHIHIQVEKLDTLSAY